MAVELTAVRLLAPFFGDSAYVWTNVIGVILLALALGAFTGGSLAERPQGSPLGGLLLGAAAFVALVPWVGPWLGDWLLPQDLPLDAAMPALVRGSLVASFVLFAPAIWLLGAVTPGLVVGAARGGATVGAAAGVISAAGTIGSLVGTFLATHWLVPTLGCRSTLLLCALLLVVARVVLGDRRHAAIAIIGVVVLAFAPMGPLRAPLDGQELLEERESAYQYLRVVRSPSTNGSPQRTELKINEGLDSYHSVAIAGAVLTSESDARQAPSSYYDYHALAPILAGDGVRPEDLRALSIGDAAGTIRRIYAGVHPGATVDAVELDPAVVELGDAHFRGARAAGRVVAGVDGRVFVARANATWHAIHLDAYSHQVYIPGQLASLEFFRACAARLVSGGVVACNVGGLDGADPVLVAIATTMAAVFDSVAALHVPNSRNMLLIARKGGVVEPARLASWQFGTEKLEPRDEAIWRRVVDTATTLPWTIFRRLEGAAVLLDDRPRLDSLLDDSYVEVGDSGSLVPMSGGDSAESAEAAAYAAFARGDARATLEAAAVSRRETAYLRYLCGAARWSLRELDTAALEFGAARKLSPTAELDTLLGSQLAELD
ncbi:MAG: fused MFS/spermidine synthase, partial [Planctomycetota bacterium]